jgi:flagellar biosynthesis/type III secretory pathway protein FliH
MKSSSETLRLSKPLRDIRAAGLAAGSCAGATTPSAGAVQASYERGRIDGEKTLSEQLLQQRAEMQTLVSGVLASLRGAVPQVIRDGENLMVSLALEVAQKLVAEMPISVPMIEAAVRDALAQVEGTAKFTVRLHPADLELLQKAGSPILASGEGAQEFRFLGSPEVTRGGCLVQTQFGTVDARRETKFDLLRRNLVS